MRLEGADYTLHKLFSRGIWIKPSRGVKDYSIIARHDEKLEGYPSYASDKNEEYVSFYFSNDRKYNYISRVSGRLLNNVKYDIAQVPNEGWGVIGRIDKQGNEEYSWVSMKTGKRLSDTWYEICGYVREGWAPFRIELAGYKHYYNMMCMETDMSIGKKMGQRLDKNRYMWVDNFFNGWASAQFSDDDYNYINKKGERFNSLKYPGKTQFVETCNGFPATIIMYDDQPMLIDTRGVAFTMSKELLSMEWQKHLRPGYEFDKVNKVLRYNGEPVPDDEQPFK